MKSSLNSLLDRFQGAMPLIVMIWKFAGSGALIIILDQTFVLDRTQTFLKASYVDDCLREHILGEDVVNRQISCGLGAQFQAAESAEISSRYAGFALILTLVGVLLLARTLMATQATLNQAETTTNAVLMEQRPWLSIEDIKITSLRDFGPQERSGDPENTPARYLMQISISLTNRGKLPAHDARVYGIAGASCIRVTAQPPTAAYSLNDDGTYCAHIGAKLLCEKFAQWKESSSTIVPSQNATILPNSAALKPIGTAFGNADEGDQQQECGWHIVIGVMYRLTIDGDWAHTFKVYRINQRVPPPHAPGALVGCPEHLTASDVVLEHFSDEAT